MACKDQGDLPFLTYVDELMDQLHHNVPKALREFDAEAIHDARVATRRLKAAVDLVQPCLTQNRRKPLEKQLKKLRKRLGPLRDLDVMIDHLTEIASKPAQTAGASWLRDQLIKCRDEEREESRNDVAPADVLAKLGAWWPVRQEIADAHDAIDSLLAESLHLQLDAFAERASRAGMSPPHASNILPEERDPHQLRITGKRLRYTLELAQEQGHKLPPLVLREFKRMQEALGTWHDYVVLAGRAMQTSLDQSLAYHDLAMQEKVLDVAAMAVRRAQRELAGFSKLWQQRGEEVARTIREKFPLTRPVSEPQTGPGPSDSGEPPTPAPPPPDVASTA